jgi:hypothetical protein
MKEAGPVFLRGDTTPSFCLAFTALPL